MSACRVANVLVLRNGGLCMEGLAFQLTLDAAAPLEDNVVLRCIFIGDCSSRRGDLELASMHKNALSGKEVLTFESRAPSLQNLRSSGMIGENGELDVGALYLTAEYMGHEFCRVGFFLRLEYKDPALQESPPAEADWDQLCIILGDPKITCFDCPEEHVKRAHMSAASTVCQGNALLHAELLFAASGLQHGGDLRVEQLHGAVDDHPHAKKLRTEHSG